MNGTLLSYWTFLGGTRGVGNAALLEQPLTAFFASRRCSGKAIRTAMDWAVEQARNKTPLIGGFHSPLEQSVLEVMLMAHAPVVMVIARRLETAQLTAAWRDAVQAGTVAVVCMEDTTQRLTAERAMRRNYWIAAHATQIVVAEAAPDGGLASCLALWKSEGHQVNYLLAA
jgi:predicted Rossmann fold nucleotide-binding protein DprA/Smf involved in DNA uptake